MEVGEETRKERGEEKPGETKWRTDVGAGSVGNGVGGADVERGAPARPAGLSEAPQPRAWTAFSLGGSSGVLS